MTLTQRLTEYIAACFTGLWIQSAEHDDAIAEIAQMCRQENWRCAVWDVERGLQLPSQSNGQLADAGGTDPLAAIRLLSRLLNHAHEVGSLVICGVMRSQSVARASKHCFTTANRESRSPSRVVPIAWQR